MRCTKCNTEVPSSYMKCPSCGQGFHGINTPSSFDKPSQNLSQRPSSNQGASSKFPPNTALKIANLGARFFGILLDTLIIIVPILLIVVLIGLWGGLLDEDNKITALKAQLIGMFLGILYEAVFLSSPWQATPGKRLLGLKVADLNGLPISFWRAFGRVAAKFLSSILLIGYIMAFFTKDKRALHDLMAGTIVIEGK
jgi:uncharacterized RDD family membrane protein YckC